MAKDRSSALQRAERAAGAFREHWIISTLAVVLTLVGGALAVWDHLPHPPDETSGAGTDVNTSAPPAATEARPSLADPMGRGSVTAADLRPSDCLDDSLRQVPCANLHNYEVVDSSPDCPPEAVLAYLGGERDVDHLLSDAPLLTQGGVCLLATDEVTRGSARGVLQSRAGDGLRSCLDLASTEVPCDEIHKGELVYDYDTGSSDASCREIATTYMNRPVEDVPGLDVREGDARCYLAARGADQLDASLRRLGTSSLPLA